MTKEQYAGEGIPGWMSQECLVWLARLGRGCSLGAEAGCWKGRSTKALSSRLAPEGRLYAIDTWAGVPDDPKQHDQYFSRSVETAWDEFRSNLRTEIDTGLIIPLRLRSLEGAQYLLHKHDIASLDFAFIDADHRYESVRADIKAFLPLVRRGGYLAGHDYKLDEVKQAVDECFGRRLRRGPGSIWYIKVI